MNNALLNKCLVKEKINIKEDMKIMGKSKSYILIVVGLYHQ